jgi:uncharacterized protein (TIGR02246 family)
MSGASSLSMILPLLSAWLVGCAQQPIPVKAGYSQGHLFVMGSKSDNVVEFDPITTKVVRSFTGGGLDGSMSGVFGPNGNLFVASGLSDRVVQFDAAGNVAGAFKTPHGLSGLVFGPKGTLFVTIFGELNMKTFVNSPDRRIIEYTPEGKELQTITHPELLGPAGITIDPFNTLYVAAANTAVRGGGGAVLKFDLSGRFLGKITHRELDGPLGVAVKPSGEVFVTSFFTRAVLVFDRAGNFVRKIESSDLKGPTYLTFDALDNLYVSSLFNNNVVVFDSKGNQIKTLKSDQLDGPYGVTFLKTPPSAAGEVAIVVARVQQQWVQALQAGDVEALSALYTEDAYLTPPSIPFRVEGREAIKAAWASFMRAFPQRQIVFSQPFTRVYAGGTIAVAGGYCFASLLDQKGNPVTDFMRNSITLVKVGERWLIADHHMSDLPARK